eukprot:Opistho-1_new@103771
MRTTKANPGSASQPHTAPRPGPDHQEVFMKVIDSIVTQAAGIAAVRRDIHAHPELCFEEVRTADVVAQKLTEWGIPIHRGMGTTGVVGIIKNGTSSRAIGLRADMDALPVEEKTGLPFASKQKANYLGKEVPVMHACGHDAHVAMLMGAAEALAGMRAQLPGTVKFIFQPAEEGAPVVADASGKVPSFGAKAMIEAGALKDVQAIYGLPMYSALI